MAAQILGAELRMPIFEVDVSNAMSDAQIAKRLIERTFAEARRSNAIVLFERAGPLLARHPPGGHFVSQLATQLTHLLSLSREYAGIVIFVSRVSAWIDPAVARCLDFVVEFPFPDSAARDEIWRRLLTSDARLSDADRKYLATQFGLPGRAIRSGCAAAAEDARKEGVPVELRHVVRALEREQNWVPSDQPRGSDGSLVFRRRWEPPGPDAEVDQPPQPAVRRMTRGARHPRIKPTSGE
jgi:SpoVK/Ycf46/Vps4 family AAA+-type ATPase